MDFLEYRFPRTLLRTYRANVAKTHVSSRTDFFFLTSVCPFPLKSEARSDVLRDKTRVKKNNVRIITKRAGDCPLAPNGSTSPYSEYSGPRRVTRRPDRSHRTYRLHRIAWALFALRMDLHAEEADPTHQYSKNKSPQNQDKVPMRHTHTARTPSSLLSSREKLQRFRRALRTPVEPL